MILGLSPSHNASACLIDQSGNLLFCASEERFSRKKNDCGIPSRVLRYIFSELIDSKEISAIAIGDKCMARFHSSIFAETIYLAGIEKKNSLFNDPSTWAKVLLPEIAARILVPAKTNFRYLVKQHLSHYLPGKKLHFFDHHLSHAASSYYCSPFEDALVITLDGSGDDCSGVVCHGQGASLKSKFRLPAEESVGTYYKSLVALFDFLPGSHEGKITGLAALGDPSRFYKQFQRLLFLETDANGRAIIRSRCAQLMGENYRLSEIKFSHLLANHAKDFIESRNLGWDAFRSRGLQRFFFKVFKDELGIDVNKLVDIQDKADLAASCQAVLEDVVVNYVASHLRTSPSKNLALAGGVFANVKLNQKILENSGVDNLYIHPAMGDEGLAVGAAKYFYHSTRKKLPQNLPHLYVGAKFRVSEEAIRKSGLEYVRLTADELSERAAQALRDHKIVGLFRAEAEYGPRALGHRTILANPTDKHVNQLINAKLKRTEFMPFAPVVLDDSFAEIFESDALEKSKTSAKFMTITLQVKEAWRNKIPAVVHTDGSARPQIISDKDDEVYYGTLVRFQAKTGIGALINTSFNMHEEPIVNCPNDAIRAFQASRLDYLILGDFWCSQSRDAKVAR